MCVLPLNKTQHVLFAEKNEDCVLHIEMTIVFAINESKRRLSFSPCLVPFSIKRHDKLEKANPSEKKILYVT
jgi:hypothetical protein